MAKIEKMSAEQESQIPAWREAWRAIGLNTDRIVPDEARDAVRELYSSARQPHPKIILVAQSPMQALILRGVMLMLPALKENLWDQLRDQLRGQLWGQLRDQLGGQLGGQLRDQLRDQLGDQLRDQLRDQLGDQLGDQLRGQLRGQLRDQLRDQLGDQLGDQLRDQLRGQLWGQLRDQLGGQLGDQLRDQLGDQLWGQLRDQLGGQLRDQLRDQLGDQLRGQLRDQLRGQLRDQLYQTIWMIGGWDSFWLAFYEAGRAVGASYPEELEKHFEAYVRYAKTCGIAFCYKEVAIVCDRPSEMHFDEARRLHFETGAALQWTDGYGVFAWHGYRLPLGKEWIITEKHKLSPDVIDAEPNAEVRRVMLEVYGFEKYIEVRGAKVIDQDTVFDRPRRLLEMNVGGETVKVLDVWNGSLEPDGSRRRFFLGALTDARTAHEAVAMSYGIHPSVYSEGVRT